MFNITPIITVPARNEEERLPKLFESIAAQTWFQKNKQPLQMVIVLNNCTDNSRQVVEDTMQKYPMLAIKLIDVHFAPEEAHVGTARKLAMDTALTLAHNPAQTAILTTDADSTPLPGWIVNNLRHLAEGIDLVCGLIWYYKDEYEQLGTNFSERTVLYQNYIQSSNHLIALLNPLPHDPWPHHSDNCGPSLAIKANVYEAVGGLPLLRTREDNALVKRVIDAGYLVRHPMDVVVETSARLSGQADGGTAEILQSWTQEADDDEPLLVEHPELIRQRLKNKNNSIQNDFLKPIPVETAMDLIKVMIKEAEGLQ